MTAKTIEAKDYKLHFIGSRNYGLRRFIAESRRIGSQRAVPFTVLKALKWEDPILLAEHRKVEDEKGDKIPYAVVFGYMHVTGISDTLPEDVRMVMMQSLDVEEISPGSGATEQRACGSYSCGATVYVKNDLKSILEIIEKACEQCKRDPTDFKYFIRGDVQVFEHPTIIQNMKFARGYSNIKLPIDITTKPSDSKRSINLLYDYQKKEYMNKSEASRVDRIIDEETSEALDK